MDTEDKEKQVIQQTVKLEHIASTSRAFPVSISMRIYYTAYHLWAAKHFVKLAKKIEDEHTGSNKFDIAHRAYITNTIFSAAAFMEAAINGVFQDAFDAYDSHISLLEPNTKILLSEFWRVTESEKDYRVSVLDKYQTALSIAKKEMFKKGENPYQDANLVLQLRNTLVHYKPQTLNADSEHDLVTKLKGKFSLNNLMKNPTGNPIFPDLYLGYGCAAWVIESSKNFADEFFRRIGVTPNYQTVTFDE